MFSLKTPIAEGHKMITRSYNHMDRNIENIIKCNVINLMLYAELLPQGEVILKGSYDLALCYSSRTGSGELGCVLHQLHKRFEESLDININSEINIQNLQPVVFFKENPVCSSITKGSVVETTVQMDIGIKLYEESGNTNLMENVDENNGVGSEMSERKPVKKLIIRFDSDGKTPNQNGIEEPLVDETESVVSEDNISEDNISEESSTSNTVNKVDDTNSTEQESSQFTVSELNKIMSTEQEVNQNKKVKAKTRSLGNKGKNVVRSTNEYDAVINYLMNKGKEKSNRLNNTGLVTFGGENNNIVRGRTRSKSR